MRWKTYALSHLSAVFSCLLLVSVIRGPLPSATAAEPKGDPRFGAVEAFRAPKAAGEAAVRWQRILFWWNSIQPTSATDWNSSYLPDGLLKAELGAGRSVVGCLINTPPWANGGGHPFDPPKNLYLPYDHPDNYWGQFVKRIVSHYKGRIDTWVIWNEPDVWDPGRAGYTWSGSVADYYQLLKVAYLAAKAADPQTRVLLAGLTYWWDAEYGRQQYFERLLEVAKADPTAVANNWYFDAAVLQLYNDPKSLYDIPLLFHQIMAKYGFAKPIWINETNVAPWDDPLAPLPRERFRATLDEQASFVIQAFVYALAAGVERISLYKMSDDPIHQPGTESFGLIRGDGSPRPAYTAFQVVTRYFAGAKHVSVERRGDVVRGILEKEKEQVTVLWNQSPKPTTVYLRAKTSAATMVDKYGRSVSVRPQSGYYMLPLTPATHNTAPGEPNRYLSGGSPLLLVEPKGQGNPIAPPSVGTDPNNRWVCPETGGAVSGDWLKFLREHGGTDNLGYPRTGVINDPLNGGQTVQYFQRAILEWHPENPPAHRIQRRLLGDILYPGADPPADPKDAPLGPHTYFPFSPERPTGLGHFVADFTRSGQPIYFKEYFDAHGGMEAFGYPKEEPKLRNGWWTQRFQAAVFEYHPENDRDGFLPGSNVPYRNFRVLLELLGDEYLAKEGLILDW
ncbi:MAG: hypothetical protein M1136_03075 [Chloroflexi bacterium]|nr:hypothetical protein [Chloroflexota bacterium]